MAFFLNRGYVRNNYEKCALALPPTSVATGKKGSPCSDGVVLIEVDDILEGGNDRHRALMEEFYSKFKCGKRKRLIDLKDEGTLISGIRVRQFPDKHFEWDMNEYSHNKLQPIECPRGTITKTEGDLPETQLQLVSTCNGQIGWLGGNGKPDIACGHSLIASEFKDKKPSLITDCNMCVKQARAHDYRLKIWPIPISDLRMVTFCDSAFNPQGVRHQQGWIVCITNQYLNLGQKAPVSVAMWKSRKLPRKAGSPTLTETYAASYASADQNWCRCILLSLIYGDFDIRTSWPASRQPPAKQATVLRTDRPEIIDPFASLVSDSKGVFDALNNELPQDDKKAAVEMPIIEELLARSFGRSRWVPHNKS